MPITYATLDQAKQSTLPILLVVMGVPSSWGEAAKGILHVKGIDYLALPLDARDEDQQAFTGGATNAPSLLIKGEAPATTSLDIMLAAERLEPAVPLLPSDPMDRAFAIGLAHEIFGENGLAWTRRVSLVHRGLRGEGGFPEPVARYLADKYGANHMAEKEADARVAELLTLFFDRLVSQKSVDSPYLIGRELTAVDIHLACALALFGPLPQDQCPMNPKMRPAFSAPAPKEAEGTIESLLAFRDFIYQDHLELPLDLGLAS